MTAARRSVMFINGLEQLLRRKIFVTAAIATLVFLALYWWGVSAAASADLRPGPGEGLALGPADAALAAIVTASPLAATLVTALMIVIGSSMMPEEIDAGRMPFWLSLPQSRLRAYLAAGLAPLALSLLLAALLFAGILLITGAYFTFTPGNLATALIALPAWLMVVWSAVLFLSLVAGKVASMLIVFFLAALSSLFGGLYEIMRMFPGEAPPALAAVTDTVLRVFPADRAYRGVLYGLIPREAVVTEGLAFFGVTGRIPPSHMAYTFMWSIAVLALGYWRFSRTDF